MSRRRLRIAAAMLAVAACTVAPPAHPEEAALFLPGAGDAGGLFKQMRRAVQQRDWAGAADRGQQILSRHADRVLGFPESATRWGSASEVVAAQMARWPEAGIVTYRELFEAAAVKLLASGDVAGVVRRYPLSAAAGTALRRLADEALEQGDVGVAADRFDRLLQRATWAVTDPWVADPGPVVQRAAVAYARAGLVGRLERLRDSRLLRDRSAGVTQTVEAAARLARARAARPPVPEDWRTVGGGSQRRGVGGPPVSLESGVAWRVDHNDMPAVSGLATGRDPWNIAFQRNGRRPHHWRPDELNDRYRPLLPVVADGIVYVSGGTGIQAFELYTGRLVRQSFYDADVGYGREKFEPNLIHTLTYANGALYAQVAVPNQVNDQWNSLDIKEPIPERRLVCVDAETGRERWAVGGGARGLTRDTAKDFAGAIPDAVLDGRSIVAPALVQGDVVYTVARQNMGGLGQFYATALDAATGKVRWATRICDGGLELNMFGRPLREAVVSPLALHGGLLYICTNIGAVAAVEARTGAVRWISAYDIVRIPYSQSFRPQKRAPTWDCNPVVVAGDLILVAPTDGPDLLALDRRSGALRWKLPGEPDDQTYYTYLLGVVNDQVIVSGTRLASFALRTGDLNWQAPDVPLAADLPPPGRGVLTADGIYWPTPNVLRRYDLAGKLQSQRPWAEWDDENRPTSGNCLLAGGALLVSWVQDGAPGLTAVFERRDVLADLESAAKARPADPRPLLTAAEVRLQADPDLRFAELTLRRASQRVTRLPPGPAAQSLRARVRRAELRLHLRKAAVPGDHRAVLGHLEAALAAADRPRDRVRVLFQLAERHAERDAAAATADVLQRIAREHPMVPVQTPDAAEPGPAGLIALRRLANFWQDQPGQAAKLVAVLQEILERFGATPLPRGHENEGSAVAAGTWARDTIRAVIRVDRAPYAPFDAQARALVDGAKPGEEEAVLHTLLSRYPNAAVIGSAVLRLSEALRAQGRRTVAARALRDWLREAPGAPEAPAAAWLLARCYEESEMYAAARAVLERLVRTHPDVALVPFEGGSRAPAAELVRTRLERAIYADTRGRGLDPMLAAPLEPIFQADLDPADQLVVLRGIPPRGAESLVLLSTKDGRLRALDARTGAPVWSAAVGRRRVFDVLAGDKLLLVASTRQVTALNPADGEEVWRRSLPVSGLRVALAAARGLVVAAGAAPRGQRSVVSGFEEKTGDLLWQRQFEGKVLPPPQAQGESVALFCQVWKGRNQLRTVVRVLDLVGGEQRQEFRSGRGDLTNSTPPVFLPDGRLAALGEHPDEVRLVDPVTGTAHWAKFVEAGPVNGALRVNETRVVTLTWPGGGRAAAVLTGLDTGSGAALWTLQRFGIRAPALRLVDDELFVTRALARTGELVLEKYDTRAPKRLEWAGDLGRRGTEVSSLMVAQSHVAALVVGPAPRGGRLEVSIVVFHRRSGKRVQDTVAIDAEFDQPPRAVLTGAGTIALHTPGLLLGYGK
ncbi:MAG: outer membrane protein assembly factor BamB family protein [Planctomycetota bacterium]